MANVPSSTSAIRPTAIPARCARSSAVAEAGFLTVALRTGMSNCRAILGGNAMGITDMRPRVVRGPVRDQSGVGAYVDYLLPQ
jgi:hypothetical protein